MNKKELIENIEQNLSILLSLLNYRNYIIFIKSNRLVSLYDKNIDKPYCNILFNKNFLDRVNEIIIDKIASI